MLKCVRYPLAYFKKPAIKIIYLGRMAMKTFMKREICLKFNEDLNSTFDQGVLHSKHIVTKRASDRATFSRKQRAKSRPILLHQVEERRLLHDIFVEKGIACIAAPSHSGVENQERRRTCPTSQLACGFWIYRLIARHFLSNTKNIKIKNKCKISKAVIYFFLIISGKIISEFDFRVFFRFFNQRISSVLQ